MPNEKILLRAEAKKLSIPEYGRMSLEDLKTAIKSAKGTSTPVKGKAAPAANGATPTKGKTATPAKGKSSSAPAKGKSTAQKTTAKSRTAAQGKASRATTTKGKAKPAARKQTRSAPARKQSQGVVQSYGRPKAKKTRNGAQGYRNDIDRTAIDWKAETNIGNRGGKREEVMIELRKRNGNYDKVFDALVHRAKAFYPSKTKAEAEKMLRWLINRVAYDFVLVTGQHEPGERAGYGQSKSPRNANRRAAPAKGKAKPKARAKSRR